MPDFRETLCTVDRSGARRWVYPMVVPGRFYRWRRRTAYLLMAVYVILPWLQVSGEQAVRLDIPGRRFFFFGATFWATDTLFLFLVLAGLALCLFLFTALLGRVWCGWACPETVFLEFLFRPIEALIEGPALERLKQDRGRWTRLTWAKKILKYIIFALVAWGLSFSALAYFIGPARCLQITTQGFGVEPGLSLLLLSGMGLLLFQFAWFREQFCTVVCPYARFQAVLLDPHSIMIGYDAKRGEPRGRLERLNSRSKGDCIDCGLCARVCPTGIDIRNGLQLECIQCTQCADACDSVMARIGRPLGLIRYDTEAGLLGNPRQLVRPRVVLYLAALLVFVSLFGWALTHRASSEVQISRGASDVPFSLIGEGRVINHLHVYLSNKEKETQQYYIRLLAPPSATLITPINPFSVAPDSIGHAHIFIQLPRDSLKGGMLPARVEIETNKHFRKEIPIVLLGPE